MKNQLLMLKAKWEKSGTGEGMPIPKKTDRNIESDYGDPNNAEVDDGTQKKKLIMEILTILKCMMVPRKDTFLVLKVLPFFICGHILIKINS